MQLCGDVWWQIQTSRGPRCTDYRSRKELLRFSLVLSLLLWQILINKFQFPYNKPHISFSSFDKTLWSRTIQHGILLYNCIWSWSVLIMDERVPLPKISFLGIHPTSPKFTLWVKHKHMVWIPHHSSDINHKMANVTAPTVFLIYWISCSRLYKP